MQSSVGDFGFPQGPGSVGSAMSASTRTNPEKFEVGDRAHIIGLVKASEREYDINQGLGIPVHARRRRVCSRKRRCRAEVGVGDARVEKYEADDDHQNQHQQLQSAQEVVQPDAPFSRHAVQQAREGVDSDGDAHNLACGYSHPGGLEHCYGKCNRVGRRVSEHKKGDAEQARGEVLWNFEEVVELCWKSVLSSNLRLRTVQDPTENLHRPAQRHCGVSRSRGRSGVSTAGRSTRARYRARGRRWPLPCRTTISRAKLRYSGCCRR